MSWNNVLARWTTNIGAIVVTEEPYFTLEVREEWKQFFPQEALAYLRSAQYKILYAILDMHGFYYVKKERDVAYKAWNRKLFSLGSISDWPDDIVDYLDDKLPADLLLDKIHLNFFGTVHSFFDTYGQFLYRTLFPNKEIHDNPYFYKVKNKIAANSTMSSISSTILNYTSMDTYSYISDMNNANKHSRHISPQSTLFLNDGEQKINIPAFQKGSQPPHDEQSMQDLLEESNEFIIDFFRDVTNVVLAHVKGTNPY